jgi:predicted nucleotidyltransferase
MNVDEWLPGATILRVRHGSHAYGTNIEGSDMDVRGICIAPREYHLGYRHTFEQSVSNDPDVTIFSLQKFCKLAADGNPNALELLFVEYDDVLHETYEGACLRKARELFLSTKLKYTLAGYAHSQLRRIETHRRWLLHPPTDKPTREEHGLPERTVIPADQIATATALVRKQIEAWDNAFNTEGLDVATRGEIARAVTEMRLAADEEFRAAGRVIGLSENFLAILDRERAYAAAKTEWDQYTGWQKSRNPARHETELKYGYDTKHGMHLIRLMRMCCEVLETGVLQVRRPDAAELLSIRNGAVSFDELVTQSRGLMAKADVLYHTTKLPKTANHKEIDALCVRLTLAHVR